MKTVYGVAGGDNLWTYNILDDDTAEITGYLGSDTKIIIPTKIDGLEVRKIGKNAFRLCSGLNSIEIPNTVTEIGSKAFQGCDGLDSIELPDNLTVIGDGAFQACDSLNSIEIPKNVTMIGEYVFTGCKHLSSIEVSIENTCYTSENGILYDKEKIKILCYPAGKMDSVEFLNSVTEIGSYAFSDCRNLDSIEIPSSVTEIGFGVFSHCSSLKSVVIQGKLTSIPFEAFYGCSGLSNIELPSTVTSIGPKAFYGCSGLSNIEIPSSVTSIGAEAFRDCSGLSNIEIPSSVTSIGGYAFRRCGGLNNIIIPSSVTSIGEYAFQDCDVLENIEVSVENEKYASEKGILYDKEKIELICCPSGKKDSIEILNGVKCIGGYAFEGCANLNSIKIPNSVTEIKECAFEGCSSLNSIEIPNSVTSIAGYAFEGCSSLSSIEIPSGVTRIGEYTFYKCSSLSSIEIPNSVIYIGSSAFYGCGSLRNIEIPSSVKSIGGYAFGGCSGLSSIEIPSDVTYIGEGAFTNCSNLSSVAIPSSVTYIGDSAFEGCSSLSSIEVSLENLQYASENGLLYNKEKDKLLCCPEGKNGKIELPNSLRSIGDYTFQNCSLSNIVIPDSVTSIGDSVFYRCADLSSIEVSVENVEYASENGLLYDKEKTRLICCPERKEGNIELPSSLISIEKEALFKCSSLNGVEIPSGVMYIGDFAFMDCSGLSEIEIPSSVTSIGKYAFNGCSGLKEIEIPSSVTSIGKFAFDACSDLISIDVSAENVAYASKNGLIYDKEKTKLIRCPEGKDGNIELPSGLTSIGDYAFSGCNSLNGIKVPSSVKKIGYSAFSNCNNLSSIEIPKSVTYIESYAFDGCEHLTINSPLGSYAHRYAIDNGINWEDAESKTEQTDEVEIETSLDVTAELEETTTEERESTTKSEESTTEEQETQAPEETTKLEEPTTEETTTQRTEENTTDLEETTEQLPTKLPEENDSEEETTTEPEQVKQKLTSISLTTSSYTYNGYAKKPVPTVKCGTKKLVKDTDYKVTYKNNVNPGTATVIITGTGNYIGTLTKTFKINLAKVSSLKQKTSYATSKITMSWNKVKGATGYAIYRANNKNGSYKYLKSATANTLTLQGLKAGEKYYYKVRAYKTVNRKKIYGDYSDSKSMFTKTAVPKTSVVLKSRTAKISWGKVTGAQGYEIYMSTSKVGTYKKIKVVGSTTLSCSKSGLVKGKKYYFKVRSYTKTGTGKKVYSSYSAVKNVKVK